MASITIRRLEDSVKSKLRMRAALHDGNCPIHEVPGKATNPLSVEEGNFRLDSVWSTQTGPRSVIARIRIVDQLRDHRFVAFNMVDAERHPGMECADGDLGANDGFLFSALDIHFDEVHPR